MHPCAGCRVKAKLFVMAVFSVFGIVTYHQIKTYNRSVVYSNGFPSETTVSLKLDTSRSTKLVKIHVNSKRRVCNMYKKLDLFPSLFGLHTCQLYYVTSHAITENRVAVCKSQRTQKNVIFMKSVQYGQIECLQDTDDNYQCAGRTPSSAVCGCNVHCSNRSLLSNLPITPHRTTDRVISFSLYGSSAVYHCGVLRQIRLAKLFLPEWSSRVYVNRSVPTQIVEKIRNEAEVVIVDEMSPVNRSGQFWRFLVASDKKIKMYCVRDADGIFSYREALAIREWTTSNRSFHAIRDHPLHNVEILPGLFCGMERLTGLLEQMLQSSSNGQYQTYIRELVWSKLSQKTLVHDGFRNESEWRKQAIPFPIERIGLEYVGASYHSQRMRWSESPFCDYLK